MKLIIKNKIILIFLLTTPFLSLGQFVPKTSFGVKQGIVFSTLFSEEGIHTYKAGYQGGIVFKHISEPKLGIQLELNYTQKGWTDNYNNSDLYQRKLHYLQRNWN